MAWLRVRKASDDRLKGVTVGASDLQGDDWVASLSDGRLVKGYLDGRRWVPYLLLDQSSRTLLDEDGEQVRRLAREAMGHAVAGGWF